MADEKVTKTPGFSDFLSSFKISSIFKKKEPEEEPVFPLADAKREWTEALALFQAGSYDQATLFFRRSLENLIKANCPGWGKTDSSNLLDLSKKAFFSKLPEDVSEALVFLNPHHTLVKSVYSYDFCCEARDRARLVIKWIFEHRPSHSTFDPDNLPASKFK